MATLFAETNFGPELFTAAVKVGQNVCYREENVTPFRLICKERHFQSTRFCAFLFTQKTSQDLREAVFRLFGYKLDIPMSKKYKLMSMYADSPGDFLLFSQSGKHNCIQGKRIHSRFWVGDEGDLSRDWEM